MSEIPQITYLLGAGASANALPTIDGMTDDMVKIFEIFKLFKVKPNPETTDKELAFLNSIDILLANFNELIPQIKKHKTVDTFAKKLFLTQDYETLGALKGILDCYLTTAQFINGFDERYDVFFASLLKPGAKTWIEFPKNIQILSWNYDFQFEMAAANFFNEGNLSFIQNHLNIYPRSFMPNSNDQEFSIVKLNGAAGGFKLKEVDYYQTNLDYIDLIHIQNNPLIKENYEIINTHLNHEDNENEQKIKNRKIYAISILKEMIKDFIYNQSLTTCDYLKYKNCFISYSWEQNEKLSQLIRDKAKKVSLNTEILIVIGYSFPTFNRVVDRFLLQQMQFLKKIIIQSPENTANDVKEKVLALLPSKSTSGAEKKIEIEIRTSVDEFFIPYEYKDI